jgi:hypothetical protein
VASNPTMRKIVLTDSCAAFFCVALRAKSRDRGRTMNSVIVFCTKHSTPRAVILAAFCEGQLLTWCGTKHQRVVACLLLWFLSMRNMGNLLDCLGKE